ncbi:hypothetical protein HCN51_03720 [Nonomuraea sp. FMUSA5-5]|uniref:Excreted virulence factor EspC, type VII ESX diderm n=1 Tax=Nonomuraea composti TaxID=2720023 RepID=A0ABX1B0P7_9ACTN|nr:hypothetical protein [Nonomuraea sp. FMUSA5-5]NJP88573.1 hypothetical protein [Nonomuraea sp. FMUSA5-5]
MEFDGVVYSKSELRRLARGTSDVAGRVSGTGARYETSASAARAAVGDDDYGRGYRQARGTRLDAIGAGLNLLAGALGRQESRLLRALRAYRDGDDASTIRG